MKDYIVREIEKLSVTLAGLMGLKASDKEEEFMQLADAVLLNEYGINLSKLLELNTDDFKCLPEKGNYKAGKLDFLAQLLYLHCGPFSENPVIVATLEKVIVIFDLSETKYHWQSFENIGKRNLISQFLNVAHE